MNERVFERVMDHVALSSSAHQIASLDFGLSRGMVRR
jgi:hypothetical protein